MGIKQVKDGCWSFGDGDKVCYPYPADSGGGASGYTDTVITEIVLTEQVAKVSQTLNESAIRELQKADEVFFIAFLNPPAEQTTRGSFKFNIEITGLGSKVLFLSQDVATANATPSSATPNKQAAYSRQWLKRGTQYGAYTRISSLPTSDYGYKQEYSSQLGSLTDNTNIDFANPRGYYVVAQTSTAFGVGSNFMVLTRRYS